MCGGPFSPIAQALNYFKRKGREKGLNYFRCQNEPKRLPLRLFSKITQRTCTNFALFPVRCRCPENRYYLTRLELIERAKVFIPKGKRTRPASNKVIWN